MNEIRYQPQKYLRFKGNVLLAMASLGMLFLSACYENPGEDDGDLKSIDSIWIYEENENIHDLEFLGDKVVLSQNGVLRVLQSNDGTEIWNKEFGWDGPVGFLSYQDRLFVRGILGEVISLDLNTGNELWRKDNLGFSVSESASEDGFVVFWTRWEVILLNLLSGEEKRLPHLMPDDAYTLAPPSLTHDGQLCSSYTSTYKSYAFCQDISTGLELWHKEYDPEIQDITGTDTTYFHLSSHKQSEVWNDVVIFNVGPYVEAFDRHNGALLWSTRGGLSDLLPSFYNVSNNISQIIGDTLFVKRKLSREFIALHPKTGDTYWEIDSNVSLGERLARSREILFYTNVFLMVLSAESGEVLSYNLPPFGGGIFWTDPQVHGDRMLLDADNGLHMFRLTR